jgi:cytochrome c oxidase subunit 1
MTAVVDDHVQTETAHAHGPAKGLMRWVLNTTHTQNRTQYLR